MYSIREMCEKAKPQLKSIANVMDSAGEYHPQLFDGNYSHANILYGQKRSVSRELHESLRRHSLREFLAVSGTTDVDGAAYMVAAKVHDVLAYSAKPTDLVPIISMEVVDGWEGGALDVPIVRMRSYKPHPTGTGGEGATSTIGVGAKATIDTTTPNHFTIPILIANEMIDDYQYGLLEYHIRLAARAMGDYATDLALAVLKAASDGDGTAEAITTGTTDQTAIEELYDGMEQVGRNHFIAQTVVITPEAWADDVATGNATGICAIKPNEGFHTRLEPFDILFSTSDQLHDSTDAEDAEFTTCVSLVFDRFSAMITGRKHWLKLENYSDPIRDLAGAVVSARQDSVTVFDDSVCVVTEKT